MEQKQTETELLKESLIVLDTNILTSVYKYSLVSSKRILNYLSSYSDNLWIPFQVKKEFYKNAPKVIQYNLYKKLDKELMRHLKTQKDNLFLQLTQYEEKRFSNFIELSGRLNSKFSEMEDMINEYYESLKDETGVYKDFINETKVFIDGLLNSDQVGTDYNLVDLLEILKEGELRYKYSIPPGYYDEGKKGIEQFGDLILWKQLLKKANEFDRESIVFVTRDTKGDWFKKGDEDDIKPREELFSEFNHFNPNKKLTIIHFEKFIEIVSEESNSSDQEMILELRANNLIKRLSFQEMIEEQKKSIDRGELNKKILQNGDFAQKLYIETMIESYDINLEDIKIINVGLRIESEKIIYSIKTVIHFYYSTLSYNGGILSDGTISADLILNIEIERAIDCSETEFINQFNETPSAHLSVKYLVIDNERYIWGGDIDTTMIDEEIYDTCARCGIGIHRGNDAGGYCNNCAD